MVMTRRKKDCRDVLVYSKTKASRTTVRRCYQDWREKQGLGVRCDKRSCRFYTEELVWNGKELPLVLDHKDGNSRDNRPEMLQYLCPNCEAQQPTRGGSNKGRVKQLEEKGFLIVERDGRQSCTFISTGGGASGGAAGM